MGWTALHEAAERGEHKRLQELLDSGTYDVDERGGDGVFGGVCALEERVCARERERERERLTFLFLVSLHWIVCDESQWVCLIVFFM
jgi:hypothetical protein